MYFFNSFQSLSFLYVFFTITNFQFTSGQQIGTTCQFLPGSNFNCRQYCPQYFSEQPQRGWYNITSKKCQPLKWCNAIFHYHDYQTNKCYLDKTKQIQTQSFYPETLIGQTFGKDMGVATCINGQFFTISYHSDAGCDCFLLWKTSGKYDMNGFPFLCDEVVEEMHWAGDQNGTIISYGPYTYQQLKILYAELKAQQKSQTLSLIYRYQDSVLQTIYNSTKQEPLIRDYEIIWVILFCIFIYITFGLSYLRFQNKIVKVTKQQLIQRIQDVLNNDNAIQREN